MDVHPHPYLRVYLIIEVGRILGIDEALLERTKEEWIPFGKKKNKICFYDKGCSYDGIYDKLKNEIYPQQEFVGGIKLLAIALVDTPYSQKNGKK